MALSSKASFSYTPSDEEIVAYCKRLGQIPYLKKGERSIDAISSKHKDEAIEALCEAER